MLRTDPPPVPWLAEPVLAAGCVTLLAGREGQGKSLLALALATAIGHGAVVAGIDCQPGSVLYVDAENGEREAHRRIRGLGVKDDSLVYVEATGFSLKAHIGELVGLIDDHTPQLVVLDSMRSLAPGLDENDSGAVEAVLRPVVKVAQNRSLAVLLLHHAGKAEGTYRGSTAIGAAVELGFSLARVPEDPEGRTRRKLTCWKSRPAPEPEPMWVQIEPRDGQILLGEAEPYEPAARRRDDLRDDVLGALSPAGRSQAEIARRVDRDPKDQTVRRILRDLERDGLALRSDSGAWCSASPAVIA